MSHKLITHSPDLAKLLAEGYELEIRGGFALVDHVPYVNSAKEIKYGTLVSSLTLSAPDRTGTPDSHVIYFIGEYPCNYDGTEISALKHGSNNQVLDPKHGITINHSFSNKPPGGVFANYYDKFTSYTRVISAQAKAIDPTVTAKTGKVTESTEPEDVFRYVDTNSSRAEIVAISEKLEGLKIAIVGVGGTGGYVLDFVAKTPVREIHLFDADIFSLHNAFRAPGAPSADVFQSEPKKVAYLGDIYSRMHKYILPHAYHIGPENVGELLGMNFVFLCIDAAESKKVIIEKLIEAGISFVDVGMGIQAIDGALSGTVRLTTATATKHDHIEQRIPFVAAVDNDYAQNIQIAELNALNAALAVIRWKKFVGFYHDLGKEYNATYLITTNKLNDDEIVA